MGKDVDLNEARSKIGMVFQHFNLFTHLKAIDNVGIALRRVKGFTKEEARKKAFRAMEQVKMSDWAEHYPAQLSGGQQQRVGIARAIVHKPLLLLADEPTGNLDPELSQEIMQLFVRFNQVGTTVLIASHDLELIKQIGSPVISLQDGKVSHNGLPFTANGNKS